MSYELMNKEHGQLCAIVCQKTGLSIGLANDAHFGNMPLFKLTIIINIINSTPALVK